MALTPVFLPGESHVQKSLVGYNPWGCRESDITEQAHKQHQGPHLKSVSFPDRVGPATPPPPPPIDRTSAGRF